jgi:hypothetical protein
VHRSIIDSYVPLLQRELPIVQVTRRSLVQKSHSPKHGNECLAFLEKILIGDVHANAWIGHFRFTDYEVVFVFRDRKFVEQSFDRGLI